MIIKKLVKIIFILLSINATAQQIRVINSSSQNPVVGALVQVADKQYVTNNKGLILTDVKGTKEIVVSHLNYETYHQSLLLPSATYVIKLKRKELELDEVIVTGQFEPQSAKNSVYSVQSISQSDIANTEATSLPEVLNTHLNIRFDRDNATGSSSLSLQGISGQNIKVLLDGIPLAGRSGTANEVDISQIDLNTIERIEIVEGPMSVIYGSDALAGVINIITKKGTSNRGNLNINIHEETVGSEFEPFSEGIHNFNISASRKINDKWYAQAGGSLNRFGGWQGNDPVYDTRNRFWYPKMQYFGNGLTRYSSGIWDIHYRLDYSHTQLKNLGAIQDNYLRENTAIDEEYRTTRIVNQVQVAVDLGNSSLVTALSYSGFDRKTDQFNTYLESGQQIIEESMIDEQDSSYLNTAFARVVYTTPINDDINIQSGIDGTFEKGENSKLTAGSKKLTEVNLYSSVEIKLTDKITFRPGIRYGYNSIYTAPITPSFNLKFNTGDKTILRIGYGRGFRAPALTELYYEFVDANHRIFGNEDLEPEYSHNVNADFNYSPSKRGNKFNIQVGTFYNYIDNRITYITPAQNNPDDNTILTNLLLYKTTGITSGIEWENRSTKITANLGITGRYQQLSEDDQSVPEFIFSPEVTAIVTQKIHPAKISITANYKFTGSTKRYVVDTEGASALQTTDSYHWLNMTAERSLGDVVKLSIGVKNLLNVEDINVTGISNGSAHSGSGSSRSIGYGRSYFLKLNYNLNFK